MHSHGKTSFLHPAKHKLGEVLLMEKCSKCEKEFETPEALSDHKRDAHGESGAWIKYAIVIGVAVIIVGAAVFFLIQKPVAAVEHAKGNLDSKNIVVEYSDFQCPACGAAYPEVKKLLASKADVKFVYKHFPLRSIHANAQKAAEAGECATEQDKFWEMHDIMFENQKKLSVAELKIYAEQIGLDAEKFSACLDSGRTAGIVEANFQEGLGKGVGATPTFFVNGQKLEGALTFEEWKNMIR